MKIISSTVKHSLTRQTIDIGLLSPLAHVHVLNHRHRQADREEKLSFAEHKLLFQICTI